MGRQQIIIHTLLGGGRIGTLWSIPPSHTRTVSLLNKTSYSIALDSNSAGGVTLNREFASFLCRRRRFRVRRFIDVSVDGRDRGNMYAMDAACVRREVNALLSQLTKMRIHLGGEVFAE